MLRRRFGLISVLLMTLFMYYQVSIIMFAHVHCINGVMLVHSHPSSDNQHTHTDGQILMLAQVSTFDGALPCCSFLNTIYLPEIDTLECRNTSDYISDNAGHCICLRAPPFYI